MDFQDILRKNSRDKKEYLVYSEPLHLDRCDANQFSTSLSTAFDKQGVSMKGLNHFPYYLIRLLVLVILGVGVNPFTVQPAMPQNVFSVQNTNDSGPGSLRDAILAANATPNVNVSTPDRIEFAISSGTPPFTISPLSPLPAISDPVIIDGLTQQGASCANWPPSLVIELDGSTAGENVDGLRIVSGGSTIRGMVINRFKQSVFPSRGNGVSFGMNGGNVIECCFIGTNATGTIDFGNEGTGIHCGGTSNNRIGGNAVGARNLISGNSGDGIFISDEGSGNLVIGNYIGTNSLGNAAIGNGENGVHIRGGNNTIGGNAPGARNLISGNSGSGINLQPTGTNNLVQGNYIGTDASGTEALGNGGGVFTSEGNTIGGTMPGARNIISGNSGSGISLGDNNLVQGNYIGTDVSGTVDLGNNGDGIEGFESADRNTIGGATPEARNIISGNDGNGILIAEDSCENLMQGNYIGTDITGTTSLGNEGDGISLDNIADNNTIGGTMPEARNLISGNGGTGIRIANSRVNLVQGNFIGTDINGTANLGNNANGIRIDPGASNNTIGGIAVGASNIIAFNNLDGVNILDTGSINNPILGNAIFSNGGLGIDLDPDGVTDNDSGDEDTGANNRQNFPVLTSAITGNGTITVAGVLNSTPSTSFRIELFANSACDPALYGEGETFLGFTEISTGECPAVDFSVTLAVAVTAGQFITATATDPNGNTSEFARCIVATAPMNHPPIVVNPIPDQTLIVGASFVLDLNACPAVFSDPDGDPLTYSASSSDATIATATISGSTLTVAAVNTGNATIIVTADDDNEGTAQDTFMVTVIPPPSGSCWLTDTFDNLTSGSLNGQNGWLTVPGRSSAFVVANPFGAGQVLKMDAGPNETVIMGKNVNDQILGTHRIKLNVLVDGDPDPAEPTLAKVETRTTGNPNWDKKFQLYFGAHMRLNYGPTLQDAAIFLAADELIKQRWYEVEAVVDLSTNLVNVFLDGVVKLSGISIGPGAITDISISAWDRRGVVYYDNLDFCRTSELPPGPCAAVSFFDADAEGWTVIEDVQDPVHFSEGGNPGGYISATDIGTGQIWYWQAPAKFLGDAACAYGNALNFDLRHIANVHSLNAEDVVLEGGGLKLVFDTSYNPNENWTSYSVLLREDAGWRKNSYFKH
jgi:hypothetical protein